MFFEGSLQEGISTAIQQNKLVVCFVTDEGTESNQWESEFLQDSSVISLIANESVALRLKAGSEEAGYLTAIFPVPTTPTVVVIHNGQLKEFLAPGVGKDEFVSRLRAVFPSAKPNVGSTPGPQPTTAPSQSDSVQDEDDIYGSAVVTPPIATAATPLSAATAPAAEEEEASNPEESEESSSRNTQLAAVREAAERKWKAAQEKAKADRKGKKKAEAEAEAAERENELAKDPAWVKRQAENKKHADAVKRRQQEAQEERLRILRRIEDDKAERRMRAEARQEEKKLDKGKGDRVLSKEGMSSSLMTSRKSTMTSLQVRLFDGSTIRSRFPSSATVRTDVRKWVDASIQDGGKGSMDYTFKVVLTPQPNKMIDDTEEDETLLDLDLAPSATLLLHPVARKVAAAYPDSPGAAIARQGFVGQILGIFSWLLGLIVAFFSSLVGGRPAAPVPRTEATVSHATGAEPAGAPKQEGSRIQGFQNRGDRQRDYQLYNGNSLNFEPRPDEKEEESE